MVRREEEVMEVFSKEILVGNIKIELSIQESHGTRQVVFTAKDENDRRIWRTPILDNGEVKTYENDLDAILDAEKKLGTF